MAPRRTGGPSTRLGLLAAATVVALTACGGGAEGGAALPTHFEGGFYEIVEGPGPSGVTLETRLTADDGIEALLTLDVTAPPPAEAEGGLASVECGGETVEGPLVQDAEGGSGTVEIDGLGTAALTIEENRAVAPEHGAPPLCTEHTGTWSGTSGELDGREGTFVTVGHHGHHAEDEQTAELTLREG